MKKKIDTITHYISRMMGDNAKTTSAIIGIGCTVFLFTILGGVSAVIPNRFFTRMTPVGGLEWTMLILTSTLLGAFIALTFYDKKTRTACTASATAGGVSGFFTFGCSICNKILMFLLGATGVMTYFEPLRPFLGVASVGLIGGSVVYKVRGLRNG